MRGNFGRCMAIVARWEGGFSDHPQDNGGATRYGITRTTLQAWRGKPVTVEDVKNLTREEAEKIYLAWFWQPVRGDDLPAGLDLVAFDAAVNSGASRGAKWLQGALGVEADGRIGPMTLAAAQKADAKAVIEQATAARLKFLKGLPDWPYFGRGWTNRVKDVREEALGMTSVKGRTSPAQSTTIQASAVQMASGAGAAVGAVGALDGTAQIVALAFAGVIVLAAMWIFKERLKKWSEGVR